MDYTFTCVRCGAGPLRSQSCHQRFCSSRCQTASTIRKPRVPKTKVVKVSVPRVPKPYIPKPKTDRTCAVCSEPFAGSAHKNDRYCSKACTNLRGSPTLRLNWHGTDDYAAPRVDVEWRSVFANPATPVYRQWSRIFADMKTCAWCSATFNGPRYKHCSSKCANRAEGPGGHAGRAKRAGVERRYFNILRIFERDQWTRKLCRIKTPKKLRGTFEPNAPELDHIVPISEGGPHTQENVQCACRRCNGLKGARAQGQMWLLGMADTLALPRADPR